jgi:hypothetical protein
MPGRIWHGLAHDLVWLLACGFASSVWCLTASRELGATFDEPLYVARGLEHWRTGIVKPLMRLGTMPLPVDLQTFPLYLAERWKGHPWDPVQDLDRILPWARAANLAFWWTLLVYGWLIGRCLAGAWGGRLSVAWLSCEPNLLAHAGLATTDVAMTATLLGLVYHFRTGRDCKWPRRVLLPACWFSAAVLAKASGILFAPICLLVCELERVARQGTVLTRCEGSFLTRTSALYAQFKPLRRDLAAIGGLGLIFAFAYCGCDWQAEPSFVAWASDQPPGRWRESLLWISEHLHIFSNAGEGLVQQIKHNVRGHGVYLLGHVHHRALWYYFPVLLTIKLTVPLLGMPLVLSLVRPRCLINWALSSAIALLLLSPAFRVQIGIRLVLPIVALAMVGLAAAAVHTWAEGQTPWQRRLLAAGVTASLIWTGTVSSRVWPNALSYVNELWGGTATGYLHVSESNYDWGQGLEELERWRQQQGEPNMTVWYFGADPSIKRIPVRELPLHALPLQAAGDVQRWAQGSCSMAGS